MLCSESLITQPVEKRSEGPFEPSQRVDLSDQAPGPWFQKRDDTLRCTGRQDFSVGAETEGIPGPGAGVQGLDLPRCAKCCD